MREGKQKYVSSLELGLDIGSVELVYGSPRQDLFKELNISASAQGLFPDDEFEAQAILDRIQEGSLKNKKYSLDVLAIIYADTCL